MRIPYQKGVCRVSSPYGKRMLNGKEEWHSGLDLVGLDGDRVLVAPCDGVIKTSTIIPQSSGDRTWEWGNYVRIDSNDGYTVFMCHMAERRVKAGQAVLAGDIVGIQGNTGYSFGEHCHFEVRRNNTPINPAPLLGIQNAVGICKPKEEITMPNQNVSIPSGTPGDGNVPHEWAREPVNWAIQRGILKGSSVDKPNYRLNDPATREEIIVFLYRLAEALDAYLDE